jgi:group II intron reverse transcriptase/maturase
MDGPLKVKHYSLTGRITPELMQRAFRAVKRNKGAAGVDRQSIAMFEANLAENLAKLMRELKSGTFQPLPTRRLYVDKGGGKLRPLGIPTVRDRVAQEVLRQLLSPLFEREFHEDSYGFRPGRSCHDALWRVLELRGEGFRHVVDADIQGFFDNIPHHVIKRGLAQVVADGNILDLIERFLAAGVREAGRLSPTTVGTPQGGVLSPLLANIALNFLDWHLTRHGLRFVRYADDFVILCRSAREAQEARLVAEARLHELGLVLSAEKTKVTTFHEGFAFLGFQLSSHGARMRDKSVEKYKTRIRELTRRHHNLDADAARQINHLCRGTANYFATPFSTCREQFKRLDKWLRMRLRCMKLKRKQRNDNYRLETRHLRRWGFAFLSDHLTPQKG